MCRSNPESEEVMEFALTEHLTFLEYIPVVVKSMQKCASSPELHTWPSEKPSSISLWGRQETESTTCSSRHHTWGRQVSASSQCLTQSDLELPGDSKKLYNSHANQLDLQIFDPDIPEIPCTSGSEGVRGSVGSALHVQGDCKPCAWFWRPGGCTRGEACQHCHLCPRGALQKKKRQNRQLLKALRVAQVSRASQASHWRRGSRLPQRSQHTLGHSLSCFKHVWRIYCSFPALQGGYLCSCGPYHISSCKIFVVSDFCHFCLPGRRMQSTGWCCSYFFDVPCDCRCCMVSPKQAGRLWMIVQGFSVSGRTTFALQNCAPVGKLQTQLRSFGIVSSLKCFKKTIQKDRICAQINTARVIYKRFCVTNYCSGWASALIRTFLVALLKHELADGKVAAVYLP